MATPEVTPITPSIEEYDKHAGPVPEPVHFTPEQQSKIDQIVKAAMGRAAADTRAELARTKAEAEKLAAELKTALLAAAPDATEADKLRLQLEQERKNNEQLSKSFAAERINNAVVTAAQAAGMLNPAHALRLIDVPPALADGSPDTAAITAAVNRLANVNPNLVRGSIRPGSGSVPSNGVPPVTEPVEKYFGKGSDARAANQLSLRNPGEYKRLRAEAVRKGLIG